MSKGYIDFLGLLELTIDNEVIDENLDTQTLSNYISYNGGLPQIFYDGALPGDPPGPVIPMYPLTDNPRLYEAIDLRLFEATDNRTFEA